MATANSNPSSATSQGQMTLRIVPNECDIKGGGPFVIIANEVLPSGMYYIKFGDNGTKRASGTGETYLDGLENIPADNNSWHPHKITVEVTNESRESIGSCSLTYKNHLLLTLADLLDEATPSSLDKSSGPCDKKISRLTNKSSNDATDDEELYKKLRRVPVDTPMLVYLYDEMAKRNNKQVTDALNRLGVMEKVSGKNRLGLATTARQYGQSESAIETSPSEPRHDSVMQTLTFGDLLDAVHTERSLTNDFESRQFYLIEPERDFALIISNRNFETVEGVDLRKRRGSETNLKLWENLIKGFGYSVETYEDITAADILEKVKNMAKKINDHQSSSSFVCYIETHGDKGKLYGSDSKSIDLKEVTDAFKEINCPGLRGKPKLFFIEASAISHGGKCDYLNDSEFRSRLDPAEPHFLNAISLAPESASFKSEEDGTWITDVFVKIFKNHYKDQDVCSMLLKVNDYASKAHAKNGYKQPCQLVFTTTKIVKFSSAAGSDVKKIEGTEKQNEKAQLPCDDKYWCYPMENKNGVAVVINVERFNKKNGKESELGDREGSEREAKKLKEFWRELGFAVKEPSDTTSQGISNFLQMVADEINKQQNSNCFVCCIMTHGHLGEIYGSDNLPVKIEYILDIFKEDKCPALAGKPKLFFIQACRNQEPEVMGASASAASNASENSVFLARKINPHEIDFLIGFSTLPGQDSHRDEKGGSWYMEALVEIFQKYYKEEDILSLMTRVNRKLVNDKHSKQCPAPVITLTRKFYFRSSA